MSLYYETATILANPDKTGGSFKARIFKKKDLKSSPGQIYALVAEASKWSVVLKDVIEKCGLLAEEKKLTPVLALLLTHDLLLSKGGVAANANHVLKLAITRHKARLNAEFTKARIRYGHATIDSFRDSVNNGELDGEDAAAQKAVRHPRWVRVNALKSTLEKQLTTTFAGFSKTESLAEVMGARPSAKIYYEDPNIPNLLALPSKIELSKLSAYTSGQIIFQDKASCFPAYLLDLSPDDGDVIDGCAAPGNKTTHAAAIVSSMNRPDSEQKVIAFERDKGRTAILQKMVKLASADSIVTVKGASDFIAARPGADEYSNVGAILLDPSCSGTGIVGRDDAIKLHLPAAAPGGIPQAQKSDKTKKRKRGAEATKPDDSAVTLDLDLDETAPEETPLEGKLAERLTALSTFQLHILTHAMRFSSAHKITYSTCSVHFEENEGVVFQALVTSVAKERGWKILKREDQVEGMKKWPRRGVWEDGKINCAVDQKSKDAVLDACIRCNKGTEDGTMGFFVAAFIRDGDTDTIEEGADVAAAGVEREDVPAVEEVNVAVGGEEEEWSGCSDGEDAQVTDRMAAATPIVPVTSAPKKRKNKKRKTGSK